METPTLLFTPWQTRSAIEPFPRKLLRKTEEINNINPQKIVNKMVELLARR
jgi:hypothetical protein